MQVKTQHAQGTGTQAVRPVQGQQVRLGAAEHVQQAEWHAPTEMKLFPSCDMMKLGEKMPGVRTTLTGSYPGVQELHIGGGVKMLKSTVQRQGISC